MSPVPLKLSHYGLRVLGRWDGRKGEKPGKRLLRVQRALKVTWEEGSGIRAVEKAGL